MIIFHRKFNLIIKEEYFNDSRIEKLINDLNKFVLTKYTRREIQLVITFDQPSRSESLVSMIIFNLITINELDHFVCCKTKISNVLAKHLINKNFIEEFGQKHYKLSSYSLLCLI